MKWILRPPARSRGTTPTAAPLDPFDRLAALCGKAFEGRIVSPPAAADAAFAAQRLVMHVRECSSDVIRIPFHVGDDASRTWVVSRTASGLRLKHDTAIAAARTSSPNMRRFVGRRDDDAADVPGRRFHQGVLRPRAMPPARQCLWRSRSTTAASPTNCAARRASSGSNSTSPGRSPRRRRRGAANRGRQARTHRLRLSGNGPISRSLSSTSSRRWGRAGVGPAS